MLKKVLLTGVLGLVLTTGAAFAGDKDGGSGGGGCPGDTCHVNKPTEISVAYDINVDIDACIDFGNLKDDFYSINGGIYQEGTGNIAGIAQSDTSNHAFIVQMGDYNWASTTQYGKDQFAATFQEGSYNSATITQSLNGASAVVLQLGNSNSASITQ
jgi:hypothetical protein